MSYNISLRRLITHLLHQMVHHRTTLRGSRQWSATIARTTTTTHTRTWSTKKSSESWAIRSSCGWPYPQARLGAERNPYSTYSGTKSGSFSVKIRKRVSINVLSKSNHTHGGGYIRIICIGKTRIRLRFNLRKAKFYAGVRLAENISETSFWIE